jgi:outer membrane lipoprotein-sorting protein
MRALTAAAACLLFNVPDALALDAAELVRKAMDHWRGLTSHSEMTMTIHRPDWERSMTMRAWSKGDKQSLVRVIDPPKDAGNGTLLDDNSMWTYSPRINRIIKIPSSMMSQSWMGSDFSNKDISKSTDIIDQYDHELIATDESDGHSFYTIRSVPHEDAAVVWGQEVLTVRDDYVLVEHQFWDQVETPEEWTRLTIHSIEFDLELPASLFTLSNLRNPRQ